jgi:hypothetical protein
MAQQTINIGASPNDGTGTPLRTAFQYTNSNFSELYTAVGPSGNNIVVPGNATITGDLTVDTNVLKVDSSNNSVGVVNATPLTGTDAGLVVGSIGTVRQFTIGLFNVYARMRERDNSNNLAISTNSNDSGTKDDATKSAWKLRIGSGNDNLALQRAPVGSTTFSDLLIIDSAGVATFGDGAGGTRMTLNSTGLGVGGSPTFKLDVQSATACVARLRGGSGANQSAALYISNTAGSATLAAFGDRANIAGGTPDLSASIYTNSGIPLLFDVGSTTKATIDASGNVGVGVTPSAGGTGFYKTFEIGKVGCGLFVSTASLSGDEKTYFSGNAVLKYNSGPEWSYGNAGSAGIYGIEDGVHKWYNAVSGSAGGVFTPTQAMTLDASGNLLVGKTASSTTVAGSQVQPDGTHSAVKSDGNPGFFYNTTTAISGTIALFRSNGVTVGSISQDGTNTAYNNSSDYRLKESVQPLTGGLARVNALKPSIYKWKTNGKVGEGFLAHELAEVVPFAVTGEKDAVTEDGEIEPQQVDLSKVVPILVAAIKELSAEVNALKNA